MFGLSEISSIPLFFIDIFKVYPALVQRYPSIYTFVRFLFAILFISVRIIWTLVSFYYLHGEFWNTILSSTEREKYSSFDLTMASIIIFCSVILSGLQFVWGRIILRGLFKALGIKIRI